MRRTLVALAAASLAAAGLSAIVAPQAVAAPASCNASDAAIYTAPGAVTAAPGELLACRQFTLGTVGNLPGSTPYTAYKVQYASKNVKEQGIAVSGTVIVPKTAWTGGGSRPIVAFAGGTVGLGTQCSISKQITPGGFQDYYEGDNLAAFLRAGFAVAATDGVGYLNGQTHTYVIGVNAGRALLDVARTAAKVPGSGLAANTKIGIAGYSEGGHSSLWAAQLAKSYAPELNVVGAAAGGVPGDLRLVAAPLNGSIFAGFMANAVIGLNTAYPEMPFNELLNQQGRDAIALAKKQCLVGTLANFPLQTLANYTTDKLTLDQLYAKAGPGGVTWGQVVDQQKLGNDIGRPGSGKKYEIGFPIYQYRGLAEEVINTASTDKVRREYCSAGLTVRWKDDWWGEHLTTDMFAKDDVTTWLGDRFKGSSNTGANCPWF